MNFGITISYIIAGFLILIILSVNNSVNSSNQELTISLVKSTHSKVINEVLESDVLKIGYKQNGFIAPSDIFISATNRKISYRSDLDNDGNIDIITWEFKPDMTPEHANNPNVHTLTRTVKDEVTGTTDVTDIQMGVADFKIFYYDEYGSATPMSHPVNGRDVRQIEFRIELQSDFQLNSRSSGGGDYMVTKWQKRFSPPNLRSK
ncbi:MAG: hypothetical protein WC967_12325 [Balneolaceae bacterium]